MGKTNLITSKCCEQMRLIIQANAKEIMDYKACIKSLKSEINELKTQKVYATNNKSFVNCQPTNQLILIKEVKENIMKVLNPMLRSYGLSLAVMTLKSIDKKSHIINFENDFMRRNIDNIEINKYIGVENMKTPQKNKLKQKLCEVQENFISENAYRSLSCENVTSFSYDNVKKLRKDLDSNIPVFDIFDESNKINGTYLNVDFAVETCIKLLKRRKNIEIINDLIVKLSVDGTVMNMNHSYVVYSLCAFVKNETDFPRPQDHVILGIIAVQEKYELLNHYFRNLHKDIQNFIDRKRISFENRIINFDFVICSDMKSILNFMGINSVSGKYHCCYCKTPKDEYFDVNNFFDKYSSNNNLTKRKLIDWDKDSKSRNGIIRPMIISLEPLSFIADTLHLRLRIIEKIFNSVFSTVISVYKKDIMKTIEEFNNVLIRSKISGSITNEIVSDNYIKYKIKSSSLRGKVICLHFIMSYINNNYANSEGTKMLIELWNKWLNIFNMIENSQNSEDSKQLKTAIIDLFSHYQCLKKSKFNEFGNKNYTTYMHIVCHIPELIDKFGLISIFNCQPIEELNNEIKSQIKRSNNHFNTTNSCIKHFARNNLIVGNERQQKVVQKRTLEFKNNCRKRALKLLNNKENGIQISPLKVLNKLKN